MKTILINGAQRKLTPLLMKPDLVRRTIDGIKTQTRRLNGLELINESPSEFEYIGQLMPSIKQKNLPVHRFKKNGELFDVQCPYGEAGSILWIRETFFKGYELDENDRISDNPTIQYWHLADELGSNRPGDMSDEKCYHLFGPKSNGWPSWKPNIHMPFDACRLFLEITDLSVQRLSDITAEDAVSEGIHKVWDLNEKPDNYMDYTDPLGAVGVGHEIPEYSFFSLWESINGEESVASNPWVWKIVFKVIDKPEILTK